MFISVYTVMYGFKLHLADRLLGIPAPFTERTFISLLSGKTSLISHKYQM